MSDDDITPPTEEEVENLLHSAYDLKEKIINYQKVASGIDNKYRRMNEDRNISLDDLPYGEELIRIADLPDDIDKAIEILLAIISNKVSPERSVELFEEAEDILEEARSTLEDCTDLPDSSDEDFF